LVKPEFIVEIVFYTEPIYLRNYGDLQSCAYWFPGTL
jgi:hypothetical protein